MNVIKRQDKGRKTNWSPLKIVLLAGLIVYTICIMVPFCWALITSFKAQAEFRTNIIGLPQNWVWNYSFVFNEFDVPVYTENGVRNVGMLELFTNTFLYAVGCAFFSSFVPMITAYMCARFDYFLSKVIYMIVIVTLILPTVGSLPSEISLFRALGLYDHIWGMWLAKAHFLGMYFLLFYNTFKAMPMAYTEAAKIDGANNMTILSKVILPLAKNTFFTIALIQFITFWNDYQAVLIYLPTHPTIAAGMQLMAFSTENGLSTIPMRMTGSVMMLMPILILFLCFHKRLIGNLNMGGIKG